VGKYLKYPSPALFSVSFSAFQAMLGGCEIFKGCLTPNEPKTRQCVSSQIQKTNTLIAGSCSALIKPSSTPALKLALFSRRTLRDKAA
jgi:hypothetical protein